MVAVSGLTGGAALAALEKLLQPQGLPPYLLLLAVPGLAVLGLSAGLVAERLTRSTKPSRRHSVP